MKEQVLREMEREIEALDIGGVFRSELDSTTYIVRTPDGFDVCDNGEQVSVKTIRQACEVAFDNYFTATLPQMEQEMKAYIINITDTMKDQMGGEEWARVAVHANRIRLVAEFLSNPNSESYDAFWYNERAV